ncbi:hypothetical protein CBM2615_B60003 [Cupriavidus taiwanensis]|uniref:Uncharacterized protein n=1 Tax=Cupriavidus taiwanensis TaxID=164546 RepID=A0A375EBX6_9BURK|nr:hypothetical protein CBM2614_B50003 [Cupriavidus taiwanensis]SOZ69640.1 hypothetical protein CBM2615_B60003 [Cupriavidus taiwanensis]SOZ72855.1 hypothetical protein CBM2613_B50003 [Cupriavidus taiwanensis]SPA09714.1 hypothetical protein CBM2625_B50003 [Cupriavidus taiwanensis]
MLQCIPFCGRYRSGIKFQIETSEITTYQLVGQRHTEFMEIRREFTLLYGDSNGHRDAVCIRLKQPVPAAIIVILKLY